LNVGKLLLLAKQTQVQAEKYAWGRIRSNTKTTRRNLKCRQ